MSDESRRPRVQVALTFDFDGVAPWLQVTTSSPSFISRGELGPLGVERIRAVLGEFAIKASFFAPGHTALTYPESVEAIVSDGHEIGHHGWVHENLSPLSEPEERSVLERGLEALESVAGTRPKGFRAPGWDLSVRTIDLLIEHGFSYDSSMTGSDFRPYWCRSGDIASSDEPFVFGDEVDLVEVPVAWHLDDFPYFEFVPGITNLIGLRRTDEVLSIWKEELMFLIEHIGEGCMVLTMHPQSTGRGHRILLLRRFIEFALEQRDVGFVRADEIAATFRREHAAPD